MTCKHMIKAADLPKTIMMSAGPPSCPWCEIERLNELLRGIDANRYWEGCWRDESAENARLRASLLAAADDIEAWGAYAGAYFQEKHDLLGDIEKYRAIARAHQQSASTKQES